ncbi:MAG: ABC transporter permease [Vicinamibacterales bacterium]
MFSFWRDVRYAVRTLAKAPGFTAVIVLMLALGIGANTAIFSLLDQVLLRRLPVKNPEELVQLDGPGPFRGRTMNNRTFSYPMYRDVRDRNEVFSGALARVQVPMTVTWKGRAERVTGELVSGNFFDVLGARPHAGRLFTQADDTTPGAHPVAILGHGYWTRRFGADPTVLNQSVTLNGYPMTIVGVTAPGFTGVDIGGASDVLVPVMMKAQMTPTWNDLDNKRSRWLNLFARLKPGVTLKQADAAMQVLYKQILEQDVKEMEEIDERFRTRFLAKTLVLMPGQKGESSIRQQFSESLVVLMAMVGMLLVIACANVANLLLARATSRHKEIAIRLALGAGRGRIVRQHLAESLVLALVGGMLGLLVASWTGAMLIGALPGASDGSVVLSSDPDGRVMLFALALSAVTALVFGLAPAIQATRPGVAGTLKDESVGVVGGTGHARVRKGLVVAQVALSVMLLAGAALFARSLYNLRSLDPGFKVDQLLTFGVDPALSGYDQTRVKALYKRAHERLSALPGVRSASLAVIAPLSGNGWQATMRAEGYTPKQDENMNPSINSVGPGFFATLGIPLIAGRDFTERDVDGAPQVAVVNGAMARYFWGNERNAVGKRLGYGRSKEGFPLEVVGVVKDSKDANLRDEIPRFIYTSYQQEPDITEMTFYVRTQADADGAASAVRDAIRNLDSALPVFNLKTMEAQASESLFVERMVAGLSAAFGALATLLAAIGLFGVMSYAVARRTREIGIRMALGAERRAVLWLVLREVAILSLIGIAGGLAVSLYVTRFVKTQLYGLSPTDPVTLAIATATIACVALLAGYVPARRASAVDPMLALRTE